MNEPLQINDKVIILKNRYDIRRNINLYKIGTVKSIGRYDEYILDIEGSNYTYAFGEICEINKYNELHTFNIGDIVRGNNTPIVKYKVTNGLMNKALVVSTKDENNNVIVRVINHQYDEYIDKYYRVNANDLTSISDENSMIFTYLEEYMIEDNTIEKTNDILNKLLPDKEILGYYTSPYINDLYIISRRKDAYDTLKHTFSHFSDTYFGLDTNNRYTYNHDTQYVDVLDKRELTNLKYCPTCGKIHTGQENVCTICLIDLPICSCCGKRKRNTNWIRNRNDMRICDECIINNPSTYYECWDCGDWYIQDIDEEIFVNTCGDRICSECNDRYFICDHCNARYIEDNEYDEDGDETSNRVSYRNETWCIHCYETVTGFCRRPILGYHEFNNWKLYGEDSDIRFGFELEVENVDNNIDNIEAANNVIKIMKQKVVCAHDSSIGAGFEIISHPMTYTYMMSIKNEIKTMVEYLSANGFQSHNPGTCGLHFHISRKGLKTEVNTEDETINNILMLFENFKDELISFSRRKEADLNRWAQFLSTYKEVRDNQILTLEYVKAHKNSCSTRYMALNLQNSKTIEMRLFRGTLNFNTFIATLQLIKNIVEYASNNTSIVGCTWAQLTNTNTKVKEYTKARGIESKYKKASNTIIKLKKLERNIINAEDGREI